MAHLQDRAVYEDRYDEITVELCRMREQLVYEALGERPALGPRGEADPVNGYYQYSMFYFALVESLAGERWQERDPVIRTWMAEDEEKDRHLAEVKPSTTPYCRACGDDMEIKLKTYANRERSGAKRDEDDILFMFRCVPCNTRMALWQDGSEWEGHQPRCEQCNAPVDETDVVKDNVITSAYTCGSCGHDYKNVWVLGASTKAPVDRHSKVDRRRFCFDATTGENFLARKAHITHIRELLEQGQQRAGNGGEALDPVAEAVKEIKVLKVAQMADVLAKAVVKSGYTEFKLGEPQIGREVVVPFGCLDNQPGREAYDSRTGLKKLITTRLADTNWRLMSDGIHHRLGYLSGRVRAYESDEDLRKLVGKHSKSTTRAKPAAPTPSPAPKPLAPAEPSLPPARARRGQQRGVRARGVLHPNLHILIPPREAKQPSSKDKRK